MITENEFELWIDFIRKGSIDDFIKNYVNEFLERSSNGKLPIHHACIHGQLEITQQLIDWNCKIESLDDGKWRPLHHACRENHVDIVELLIVNKCEIDPKNIDNWTPLHYASGYGHDKVVQILIDNHSDIEAKTADGWTPIHNACRFGHLENVKILLNNNCKIEIYDKDKCTPVHYACMKGYEEILQLLLDKNCNIEACDKNDWRPIHYACANNNVKIVKMLLGEACNIDVKTTEGKSPLQMAKENKSKDTNEVISLLNETLEHIDLVNDLASSMNAECIEQCDHKFCQKSLRLKTFNYGKLIGRGGFGKVYKIQPSHTNCEFAMKILNKTYFKFYSKMKDEINSSTKFLIHRRIIKFFGSFINDEKLIIFMEFASGGTIQCQIKDKKTIPIDQVIHYSRQVLEGLEFLHSLKIIHRDIKPSNILLTRENNVKLADFDLCRITTGESEITTFCGTENFMAPEIINGGYTFSADIWSLGATIINMITGKAPYEYLPTPQSIMFKIATEKKLEIPNKEIITDTMASFISIMLNPDPLLRPNASKLLQNKIFNYS